MNQIECYWTSTNEEKLHVVLLTPDELVLLMKKKKQSGDLKQRLANDDLSDKDLKGAVRIPRTDLQSVENPLESEVINFKHHTNGKSNDHNFPCTKRTDRVAEEIASAVWGDAQSQEVQLTFSEIAFGPCAIAAGLSLFMGFIFVLAINMDPTSSETERFGKAGAIKAIIETLGTQGIGLAWIALLGLIALYIAARVIQRPTKIVYSRIDS